VLNFKITGLKVIQNRVDRASKKIQDNINDNVVEAANYIEMRSRSSAPVATGMLKASQYRNLIQSKPNTRIKIGFRAFYAPFQEFGTGKPPEGHFRLTAEYGEFAPLAKLFERGKPRLAVRPRRYFLHHYIVARRALSRKTSTLMKNLFK